MTYVSKKEKVFDLPDQEETSLVSLSIVDSKLKRFPSVSDRRAWTTEETQRYQHLYGLVNGSESNISKSASFKYIPFDVLLAILMAEKDAIIQELLERQDENRGSGEKANVLYKSEGFEDSDDDRDALIRKDAEVVSLKNKIAGLESELEDYRETLTKAVHKLESMDTIIRENHLLKEKIQCSDERILCLEEKKAQLEKELTHYKNTFGILNILPTNEIEFEKVLPSDGGDAGHVVCQPYERDILLRKIQELQEELDISKANEAEMEFLRKISENTSNRLEEKCKENENYKKKLESMKSLEKHIEDVKKQAQNLTEKYKMESVKSNDQVRQINMLVKELQILKEERDRLHTRVNELLNYQTQYQSLQSKLQQVELIIDENETLNRKMLQLDKLELENAQLKMRLDYLKNSEIKAEEDRERMKQLEWTKAEQEDEIKKMLKHIEELSESCADKNELYRLRDELEDKNEKLKKYEKQLSDIPALEAEIDLLKSKLQKCIDDFKADKELLKRLQEELEACRKRCYELEKIAPLCQTKPENKSEPEHESTEAGVNTIEIEKEEAQSQSKIEVEDKSTLIIDQAVLKLQCAEEQNQLLRKEVGALTQKLSEIDLDELLYQTNELKTILEKKEQQIHELLQEVNSIRRELKNYEVLKESLEGEVELLRERTSFMKVDLDLKENYVKELEGSLELERKGREFARNMIKTLEERLREEMGKKEMGETVLKLQKEETNVAKQEIYQYFGSEVDHLKVVIHLSKRLTKELETENRILKEAKEYFEKTENKALKNLISKLRAEVAVLKSLSKPELESECEDLQEQVKTLLKETDNLMYEIKDLKAALNSEKNVKDILERELINLQAELTACVSSGSQVFGREMFEKELLISGLKEQLAKATNDLENSFQESQTLKAKNEQLQENVEELELEQKELKNQINFLKAREYELNKAIKELQEKSMKELEEKENECLEKTKELEETSAAVEYLKKELSVSTESIHAWKQRITELEEAINAVEERLKAKEKEMEEVMTTKEREMEEVVSARDKELEEVVMTKEEKLKEAVMEKEKELKEAVMEKEKELKEAVMEKEKELKEAVMEKEKELKEAVMEKEKELKEAVMEKEKELKEAVMEKEKELKEAVVEKEKEVQEAIMAKEKQMQEAMLAKEELETVRKASLNASNELKRVSCELEALKSALDEKNTAEELSNFKRDLEEKYALEEALNKIENELEELKTKQRECQKMDEEMTNLRNKRDSLQQKLTSFEAEIESLKKKLIDFEDMKNELMQLKAEKGAIAEDIEVSKLYQEVLQHKTQISNLKKENETLREELNKAEGLIEVYKNFENKNPESQKFCVNSTSTPRPCEFYTPPTLISPRSSDVQDSTTETIPLEVHKKEISDLERLHEQQVQYLKDTNINKIRKLVEQHEKEWKVRTKAFYESINSIKWSYETDIKKLVEKHKTSIMRLQGLHEDEVQELNTTYETQMEAMQTQNENLINDLRTEYTEKLKQLREQNNEVQELKHSYEDLLRQNGFGYPIKIKTGLNGVVEAENDAQKQTVDGLSQFYQASIMELEEKHNMELKKCKKSNLKRIELMKNKYEALLLEERKKYEEQLEEMLLQLRNVPEAGEAVGDTEVQTQVKSTTNTPNTQLEFHEVLQKILNEGLECLTFDELILVHSKTCFMPESAIRRKDGGGEFVKSGRGCKHKVLMAAEKEELLKRIFTLEHEIVIKQLETHEAIVNMEAAEMFRVQELKNALSIAQQKNAELKQLLSEQSKHEMNLKIDRYMSDKQAIFHETNILEKVKELEKERAEKKRLEEELQKERANVKMLTTTIETEKERQHIHRKRDAEYIKSMRQRLEEALNHEQAMEAQLDNEIKLRLRLESELKNVPEKVNFKSDLIDIEKKVTKTIKKQDQNEVAKESKPARSKSRRRSRLKSVNN